jgi:CBS domain-containing protein
MSDPTVQPIAAYVRPPDLTMEADHLARLAYRRMEGDNVRSLVVVRDKAYVGIVEWLTIRRLSSAELGEPVEKFVIKDLPTLTSDMSIADAMAAFEGTSVAALGLLPVLNADGQLEGLIEREEFQGLMEGAAGEITVEEDPTAHLVTDPNAAQHGAKVMSADGHHLGDFQRFVDDRGRPRWIEVQYGHFRKHSRYVPLVAIDHQSPKEVVLNIDGVMWDTFTDQPEEEKLPDE